MDALVDLDLDVQQGEIFGFLGPNGAGKSTTIRLLLGYLHATAGTASVLGLDAGRDSLAIRRRVGYLPGGIALYDTMTGEDILDYLCRLYRRPAPSGGRPSPIGWRCRRPTSDGRCATTRAACARRSASSRPSSTTPSWPSSTSRPRASTRSCSAPSTTCSTSSRETGRTIFFSSHVLSEVERVCDRVAIIRQGRLVALQDVGVAAVEPQAPRRDAPDRPQRRRSRASPGVSDVHRRRRLPELPAAGRPGPVPGAPSPATAAHRSDHRAGPPRGGLPRVLRRGPRLVKGQC